MQRESKLRALRRVLGHEEITKGDEVVFFCPKCNHRKPKLSVNLKTDFFHCWIDDWKGKNLVPILRLRGDSPDLQEYLEHVGQKPIVQEKRTYDQPVLPSEFRSLSETFRGPYYSKAMDYLVGRGITRSDMLRMKLGYCETGEYKYRIIIPSFDDMGELNFFSGRTFYDHPLPYKHGNFDKDIIFNDYMIDWNEPITVTEGAFDAAKAGENAIPLQGSILREGSKLFRKIVVQGVDVFFAMDTDAFKKQLRIIELFLTYGVKTHYVDLLGRKDVGVMDKAEFQKAKLNARQITSDMDLLRLRVTA